MILGQLRIGESPTDSAALFASTSILGLCAVESSVQGAFNCGPSSHPDFIKNYFLLKRMFRFFRHSRQMPYFNVSRQKVTHFNALGQKVTDLNEIEERDRGKR